MSHSNNNPFQPWKPHAVPNILNLTSGSGYVPFQHQQQQHQQQQSSNNNNNSQNNNFIPNVQNASNNDTQKGSSSCYSSNNNPTKIQSLEKLTGIENLINSTELSAVERNTKLQQFAEKNIRLRYKLIFFYLSMSLRFFFLLLLYTLYVLYKFRSMLILLFSFFPT